MANGGPSKHAAWTGGAILALAGAAWLLPVPEGLTPPAWHLFILFGSAILAVVAGSLSILTASVAAVAIAVMSGTLAPAQAYSGFANPTILLIVIAFLVARSVLKCGLGRRIGFAVVGLLGRSTLGLSYSVVIVDALIAPAFPSNTARSGVLFPLTVSIGEAAGYAPGDPSTRRLGGFLMFSGIVSLSLSSALWLTAMAANPLGAEIARSYGVRIDFGSWLLAASVPTLAAMALLPAMLYRLMRPEITATPEAPAAARRALAALGPFTRSERIVTVTFGAMVLGWAAAGPLGLDPTAVAFGGLAVLLFTGTLTVQDIAAEGEVLSIFLWFAILFTLSGQLDHLGFMEFLGAKLASLLRELPPIAAGVSLVAAYVFLHYLFVSQTAHLLALFGVFLDVGVRLGVPAAPLAFLLLFATNFFSVLTPQASSANLLFAGSDALTAGEMYRLGAITTLASLVVYLVIGIPWLLLVAR